MSSDAAKTRAGIILAAFIVGLLAVAVLRYWDVHLDDPPAIAGRATLLYVLFTVFAIVALIRTGVPFRRFGFAVPISPLRAVALALVGIAILQASSWLLEPVWERLFGAGRDLGRFSDVAGSLEATARLLFFSWVVAAFGEEIAFRIVLMRSIAWVLGDSRRALGIALVVQTVVFGLIHAYQGPTGIASTMVSGLVFGSLVLAGRGSIWPAVLAHGGNNTIGILRLYAGV